MLETWEFEAEAQTPLLVHGGRAGEIDTGFGLRPSSLRGALRFWWRARYGTGLKKEELLKKEGQLFGSTQGEAHQSTVFVRVGRSEANKTDEKLVLMPHRQGGEKDYQKSSVSGWKENSKWNLWVSLKQGLTAEQRKELQETLKCFQAFANVGQRASRGYGSLRLVPKAGVPDDLAQWLNLWNGNVEERKQDQLNKSIQDLLTNQGITEPPEFPLLDQNVFTWHWQPGFKDYFSALKSLPHRVDKMTPWNGEAQPRQTSAWRAKCFKAQEGYLLLVYCFKQNMKNPGNKPFDQAWQYIRETLQPNAGGK